MSDHVDRRTMSRSESEARWQAQLHANDGRYEQALAQMRADMTQFRSDVSDQMGQFRRELNEIRGEMRSERAETRREIYQATILGIVATSALVGLIVAIGRLFPPP